MSIDMYGEKVAEASALIREFAKVDYFHYFARDPESSLEAFIAMLEQAEEKGRHSQASRIADLERENARLDAALDEEISNRDRYHEWADKLASEIARYFDVDIGEHSNANNPWEQAYEAVPAEASAPAVEQHPIGYLRQSEIDKLADGRVAGVGMMLHKEPGEGKVAVYKAPQAADTDKVREVLASIGAARIDAVWEAMPGGLNGFLKQFGYQQFAYAILDLAADVIEIEARKSANMAAQAPVREVPDERLQNWIELIHDNERSMGDRLQSLSSTFAGLLNGDAVDKYPLRAIREQLDGEPLHAIFVPDYWRKVDEHGNPPDGLYMAIYKGDGKSLPVALVAYGEREFDNNDEEDGEEECGAPEFCWTEYQEDRDGDTFLIVREVIAYLPVNLDMKSLEAVRAALPAAPVQQEGDHASR